MSKPAKKELCPALLNMHSSGGCAQTKRTNNMKHIRFSTKPESRETIVAIKAATWLVILTWGDPGLLQAVVDMIGRLG